MLNSFPDGLVERLSALLEKAGNVGRWPDSNWRNREAVRSRAELLNYEEYLPQLLVERLGMEHDIDRLIATSGELATENAALRLERDEMAGALEPFARVRIWPGKNDADSVMVTRHISDVERNDRIEQGHPDLGEGAKEIISLDGLTMGDFRRAARALSSNKGDGHG